MEHAFSLREHVERVQRIGREDFFRYILAYRAVPAEPLVVRPIEYHELCWKYLQTDSDYDLTRIVERYNRMMWWLRRSGGPYPLETLTGIPQLFFDNPGDCGEELPFVLQQDGSYVFPLEPYIE